MMDLSATEESVSVKCALINQSKFLNIMLTHLTLLLEHLSLVPLVYVCVCKMHITSLEKHTHLHTVLYIWLVCFP